MHDNSCTIRQQTYLVFYGSSVFQNLKYNLYISNWVYQLGNIFTKIHKILRNVKTLSGLVFWLFENIQVIQIKTLEVCFFGTHYVILFALV